MEWLNTCLSFACICSCFKHRSEGRHRVLVNGHISAGLHRHASTTFSISLAKTCLVWYFRNFKGLSINEPTCFFHFLDERNEAGEWWTSNCACWLQALFISLPRTGRPGRRSASPVQKYILNVTPLLRAGSLSWVCSGWRIFLQLTWRIDECWCLMNFDGFLQIKCAFSPNRSDILLCYTGKKLYAISEWSFDNKHSKDQCAVFLIFTYMVIKSVSEALVVLLAINHLGQSLMWHAASVCDIQLFLSCLQRRTNGSCMFKWIFALYDHKQPESNCPTFKQDGRRRNWKSNQMSIIQ